MKNAIELIQEERQRQIGELGYTPEHDDGEMGGELASCAGCYALVAGIQSAGVKDKFLAQYTEKLREKEWTKEPEEFQPAESPIRNLVKAGALIVAEIERLQRLENQG